MIQPTPIAFTSLHRVSTVTRCRVVLGSHWANPGYRVPVLTRSRYSPYIRKI